MGAVVAEPKETTNGGRPAPYDSSAADAVLGAALSTAEAVEVVATLRPDDFLGRHVEIADAILRLRHKGLPIDPVMVEGELGPLAVQIGGLSALLDLQANTPRTRNVDGYAARVRETKRQRSLIKIAGDLADVGYTGSDPEKVLSELDDLRSGAGGDDLPLAQLRRHLIVGDAIKDIPPLQPLIEGVLDLDTLAALYGPSGAGKSFVAVDWALCIATGTWWHNHVVRPGRVLYIVAEGATGMGDRVTAWQRYQQVHSAGGLYWLTLPPNLFDPKWAAALAQIGKEYQPQLVVIDTLARSMVGADENTAKDMGVVVSAAEQVRRACGACVLMVHHSGKNAEAGMRGNSALRAAVDTEWECSKDEEGAVEIVARKQKNRPDGEKLRLQMVAVEGTKSVALATFAGPRPGDDLPDTAVELIRALHEVDLGGGVSGVKWFDSCKVSKPAFYRWQKRLIDLGAVADNGAARGKLFRVTEAGMVAANIGGAAGLQPDEEQF